MLTNILVFVPLVLEPKPSAYVFCFLCKVKCLDRKPSLLYISSVLLFSIPHLVAGKCLFLTTWMVAITMFAIHPKTLIPIDLDTGKRRMENEFLPSVGYRPRICPFHFQASKVMFVFTE